MVPREEHFRLATIHHREHKVHALGLRLAQHERLGAFTRRDVGTDMTESFRNQIVAKEEELDCN
eukprot:6914811-Lingulodinium_polyedra.AAC.1